MGGYALQFLQFALENRLRCIRPFLFLRPRLHIFYVLRVRIAQLALNSLHLLVQIELALLFVQFLFSFFAYIRFHAQHLQLLIQDRQQSDCPLFDGINLQQLLFLLNFYIKVRAYIIHKGRGIIDAFERHTCLGRHILGVFQKEREIQEPKENDLYTLGTAARVVQTIELQSGTLMVILEGIARIHVEEFISSRNGLRARTRRYEEIFPEKSDRREYHRH